MIHRISTNLAGPGSLEGSPQRQERYFPNYNLVLRTALARRKESPPRQVAQKGYGGDCARGIALVRVEDVIDDALECDNGSPSEDGNA